jgi:hypothetical protein
MYYSATYRYSDNSAGNTDSDAHTDSSADACANPHADAHSRGNPDIHSVEHSDAGAYSDAERRIQRRHPEYVADPLLSDGRSERHD